MSTKAILKDTVIKTISRRHPWIFSGAIRAVKGDPQDGDILKLVAGNGDFLARGYWNSQSQIQLRLLSWEKDEEINVDFWRTRLEQAIAARGDLVTQPNGACRLVNAENDFIPGLIVDRYGEWLVIQALSLGIDKRKMLFAELLWELLKPQGIYERSDADIREKEGIPESVGLLWGEEPPETIEIIENGLRFAVDIRQGHKTGFYLDQRLNRASLRETLQQLPNSEKSVVLNAFGYTGGFAVAALDGGAGQALTIDTSVPALDLAKQNVDANGFVVKDDDFVEGDVFQVLRAYREEGRRFDAIILDPPKFARHSHQVDTAARGYKDINLLAFQLLRPGGWLWTFSCSNAITPDLFQKIVFGAIVDAKRNGQIVQFLNAAPDHPIALTFPEGLYLKGLVCRVW